MDKVCIIKASIEKLPFLPEQFGFIYSIGVLHHTPSAKESFYNLSKFCGVDGFFGVYLYGYGNIILEKVNGFLRNKIFNRIPESIVSALVFLPSVFFRVLQFIPFIGPILIRFFNKFIYFGSFHNMYDAYTAGHTSLHSSTEVMNWYAECGFESLVEERQSKTALYGLGVKQRTPIKYRAEVNQREFIRDVAQIILS